MKLMGRALFSLQMWAFSRIPTYSVLSNDKRNRWLKCACGVGLSTNQKRPVGSYFVKDQDTLEIMVPAQLRMRRRSKARMKKTLSVPRGFEITASPHWNKKAYQMVTISPFEIIPTLLPFAAHHPPPSSCIYKYFHLPLSVTLIHFLLSVFLAL